VPLPDVLERPLTAPGPSGYESAPAPVFAQAGRAFSEDVAIDIVGSAIVRRRAAWPAPSGVGQPDRGDDKRRRRRRHVFRPVPLRYVITRSGQVQAAPQGSPNRNRGVFSVDSHDRSRT
jgi:hypothetical protein